MIWVMRRVLVNTEQSLMSTDTFTPLWDQFRLKSTNGSEPEQVTDRACRYQTWQHAHVPPLKHENNNIEWRRDSTNHPKKEKFLSLTSLSLLPVRPHPLLQGDISRWFQDMWGDRPGLLPQDKIQKSGWGSRRTGETLGCFCSGAFLSGAARTCQDWPLGSSPPTLNGLLGEVGGGGATARRHFFPHDSNTHRRWGEEPWGVVYRQVSVRVLVVQHRQAAQELLCQLFTCQRD